jgi:p-hydroxybenzoate 3-monooxygenase
MTNTLKTQVAIVGAGPAGLLLSHQLHRAGISSIVLESRSRTDVERTIRAGILEQGTVEVLVETGASDRVLTVGQRHDGIEIRSGTESRRIDFPALCGRSVWLYPQHEVLTDLIARRLADNGDVRFEWTAEAVLDEATASPRIVGMDPDGNPYELLADFVVGADGSRSVVRAAVTGSSANGYFREYPFGWLGILCEAPPSSKELIYSSSDKGFALISQRSETVQRMYLQCDPDLDASTLSEAEIWDSLQARAGGNLREGTIFQRDVLRFRSFVTQAFQKRNVFLMGDAAHTVPPTGAKGMNLAAGDAVLLDEAFREYYASANRGLLDTYESRALDRVWKGQHFSWWMTSMLHAAPHDTEFDRYRRLAELRSVTSSAHGQGFLAENYTGLPFARTGRETAPLRPLSSPKLRLPAQLTAELSWDYAPDSINVLVTRPHLGEVPVPTAHRLVNQLTDVGFLERDAENRVRMGMRLREVAARAPRPPGRRCADGRGGGSGKRDGCRAG